MIELWRDVPGWEDLYSVSDLGRVRSKDRVTLARDPHGNPGLRRYRGRVLRANRAANDYPRVRLCRQGEATDAYVHDLVAAAFIGPKPHGLQVCHGDGNPANNAARNLRYGTPRENCADMVRHGRAGKTRGSQVPAAKLNERDIPRIRMLAAGGASQRAIGLAFDVSHNRVGEILRNKAWKHVQ
jgi:hypothetical protein